MLRIGCHLSSSKGYLAMGKEAEKIDGGTFQFSREIQEEAKPRRSIRRM